MQRPLAATSVGFGQQSIRSTRRLPRTEKLSGIALNVGMAFQIQDDILDITGSREVLGKPVKSDEKNHKYTYASVKGLEESAKDVERYSKEAVRLLEELPCRNEFLQELILTLIHRNA